MNTEKVKQLRKQKSNDRRELKKRVKRKEFLSNKRRLFQGVSQKIKKYINDRIKSHMIVAPANFSFLENTVECIKTIESIHNW